MNTLQLELATASDIDPVLELVQELSAWLKTKDIQQWTNGFPRDVLECELERGEIFVLREKGQVVASVSLSENVSELWEDADRAALYLERLALARSKAGQRTGEAIMRWAEQEARLRGHAILRLVCDASNTTLANYYRRLGYSHVGTRYFAPYQMSFARFEKQI